MAMYICGRLAGRWAVVTLLALTAVSPFVMLAYTQARGEASGALIAVAAFALLVMPPRDPLARLIAAPLVLLLGTALRLNFLPAFVLATAFVWLTTPAPRNTRLAAALAIAIPALLLLVLPLAFAGERYWFNVWLAQASRGDQFTGDRSSFGDSMSFVLFWLSYSLERMALAVVATALIAATLYMRWRDGWRPDWRSQRLCLEEIEAICVVLALAVFLPFLGLNTFEPRYVVTSFAVLVVGVAIIVGRSSFSTADRWSTAAAGILAIALLLLPVGANFYPEAVDVREPDIDGLQNGARAVRELVPADGTLLTFDTPLAVEARRDLTPGLTMAQFSFWPRMDIDDARRRHVVTGETLLQLDARQPPALIALTTHDLAYLDAGDANFDAPRGIALLPDTNGVTHCYQLRDTIERWAEGIEPLYLYMLTPLEDCIGG